ncbi:MAG TPA: FHA domain-containing protein [Jiangellaceae bacterium]|nr:FHA domain-containing protein [Jiangellaceae bacterium]
MSELTLTVIRLGFLALLWLLILSVTSAMRADIFGTRPSKRQKQPKASKQARAAAKPPTAKSGKKRGTPSKAVIVDGPDMGVGVDLDGISQVLLGRGAECTIQLSDEYVSTQHARLRLDGERWVVEDLGSTNGTYVGTNRLSQPAEVSAKARFRLGKTVVELRK